MISEKEKKDLEFRALARIVSICKLKKIDFYSMDKKIQVLLVAVFQSGIGYYVEMTDKVNT